MILASVFLYFTVFFKVPMGSIVISTVSPFLRNLGGLKPIPTPCGVPVAITSPGRRVIPSDNSAISLGMEKIRSCVFPS